MDGRQNPLVINRFSSLAKPENRKSRMTRMTLSLTHRFRNSSAASLSNDCRVFSKLKTAHRYLKRHDMLFWLKEVLRKSRDRGSVRSVCICMRLFPFLPSLKSEPHCFTPPPVLRCALSFSCFSISEVDGPLYCEGGNTS